MNLTYDSVIIGAGQAGLAAAYYMQQTKLNFTVLEAEQTVGGAWRHYYDSLKLFSPIEYSSLPGFPLSGDPGRHPVRADIVSYLAAYAAKYNFPIKTGASVVGLAKDRDLFQIDLANGESVTARTVIVATGSFKNPHLPQLPGQEQFAGQILHAANYCNPTPFAGQRLVIVGGGNTAVQIGVELARVADVTIASREPISYVPQILMGKDIHFWLTTLGFDKLPIGQWFGFSMKESVVDDGRYAAAIKQKLPARQPMFTMFQKDGIVWEDGSFEKVDTIIFATGYRPNLPFLNAVDKLDNKLRPTEKGGVSETVPGLYFIGLPWQRSHRSATLRGVGPDSAYVVRSLVAYRQSLDSSF